MDKVEQIINTLGCDETLFSQRRAISIIEDPLGSPWTDIYSYGERLPESLHIFSCFADSELEQKILSAQDWLKHANEFAPDFCETREGVEYIGLENDGFQHIVAEINFHSLGESQLTLNEEFVLLFGLYRDNDNNYYAVDECGNKELVVEFLDKRVRAKTKYLIKFASAKQMLFVQFVDSRIASSEHYENCPQRLFYKTFNNESNTYFLSYQTNNEESFLFSMIYGRSVVRPKPMKECGIWPFENGTELYPEFIVEELPDGSFKRFTCEESKLNNNFGANPGAPHYLTPVYFKPAVLDRYRKLENFTIGERRLTCGSQWSLEIDHIDPSRVMVYLGDLGRDFPSSERNHFLNHEISPTDQLISKEVFAQDFLCAWLSEGDGPISNFRIAYKKLDEQWKKRFGKALFRQMHPDDANLIQQVRIPSVNCREEFDTVVQTLTRLLNDYMDESQFPECGKTGSINKLAAFLDAEGVNVDLSPLRNIQDLRSAGIAHAKGKKYDKVKARLLTGDAIEDTKSMLASLTEFMRELAAKLSM